MKIYFLEYFNKKLRKKLYQLGIKKGTGQDDSHILALHT